MAKKEKKTFVFQQLEAPVTKPNIEGNTSQILGGNQNLPANGSTKITFDCPNVLVDMMKDYGYWEGLSQKEIIIDSLGDYFENKEIKARPDKVKNRKKVGRKPKIVSTNPYYNG